MTSVSDLWIWWMLPKVSALALRLCQGSGTCLMELKILVENPLEIHYVVVEITDVNDHSPSFPENEQTFEIAEHTSPGKRFQLHSARDPDAGINSIRTYTLTSNEHFEINIRQRDSSKIPFLVLKKSLDREQINKHTLLVTAVDGGKPPRSGTLNVSIIVLDSNDNKPIFSQEVYQIAIQENVPVGTSIFRINATDSDEGSYGEIEYSLGKTLMREIYDIFELDKISGEIRVKGSVNYEETDLYELDVEASDKGTPPFTGECRVIIKIIDVNDNAPEIEVTSLSNTVSEDSKPGTVISLIRVKDKDSGVNGKIILHITNDVPFELKPSYKENTYSIVTKGLLDREKVSFYEITIKATDCGEPPLSAFKTLNIQISDVNDNSPHFRQSPLEFYLIENNVAGQSILSVSAADDDLDNNSVISYHIARDGSQNDIMSFLNINSDNGHITALKSFDFETLKTFQFQVVATDSGTPSLSNNVTVNVFILDQNDNAPVILYPLSSNGSAEGVEEIPRNVNAGHLVTKVRAYDADIGYNGWLLFSLQEVTDHSLFGLDRYTGQIRTLQEKREHNLLVTAVDGGKPQRTGTLNITIIVLDSNDNIPIFSQEVYHITIQENIPLKTPIFKMNATDPDEGTNGEIEYSLGKTLKQKVYDIFEVEELTGEIKIKGLVNYEENDMYELDIEASDKGTPPLTGECRVIIKITDVNDNAPEIEVTSLSNTVPEDSKPGTVISLIRVRDKDSGVNGKIILQITNDVPFELKPSYKENTYSIVTKGLLDREKVSFYELKIKATDCGEPPLSTLKTLNIQISDVNDNSPHFHQSPLEFYLIENNVAGQSILSVSAADDDLDNNAVISYHIARDGSQNDIMSFLNINSDNGHVTALKSFDFETLKTFQFQVVATDSGTPSLSNNVTVNVFILDQNDNAPVILYPLSSNGSAEGVEEIPRNVNAGHLVTKVRAYDADIGYNGWLLFSLQEVTDHSLFGLDRYTGQIRTLRSFTETDEAEHKLVILVKDNGNILVENPLEIHYVVVEITDVNDHSPSFPENEQTFEIAEHTSPGKRFQLHSARDPDAGMNSIRTYTLTSNEHFEINIRQRDSNKIPFLVLKKSLDREQINKHTLLVTAVDGGKPPRSGTLNVSIIVLDSNDNKPIFSQEVYQIAIQENVPVGTSIFRINATDSDEGSYGEIEYSLGKTLMREVYDIFELDKISGEIRVKGSVNYEETDLYELDVEASDKGTPPLTGECRVIIKIVDVNDNAPEIEVTSLSNTVSEDSKTGTVISLIRVKDKDSGVNGKIILHITNDVPFELKPSYKENTYSIVTKGLLDREKVSFYEITIKATDCGEPPLSTLKTLNIQISDVNDNSPRFQQSPLEFYLLENNVAGQSILSVSATDDDLDNNAVISYHIARDASQNDIMSFLNINSDNGHITALKSFDFETLKTFQFQVVATDSGTPSLSNNVTVNVFILDQNDNAPVILYPLSSNGSAEGVEEIPRNVNAGHLVTKVRAYDADIGYNGWLLFSLQEVTDHSLFGLDRYTGQIRTLRSFTETDEAEHKLVILVKDNGNVSLSATATVVVKVVEPKEAFAASDVKSASKDDDSNVTFYLMITLGSVSALFIISIIVLIAMQCSKSTDYTSKYLEDKNYDGTLCHSIQYRSGDKRYMLVGPRMSIGSTIVPGSNANTLVLPDRRKVSGEVRL
uniref:Protocadherin alpha-13-like n=1 Tax=Sphaeramia orbicularis TaxID=375764 RepID=A0A672YLY4_9TELE